MADEAIPADVRDFILRYIDSVAHLEALLLLRRNTDDGWTVERTAKRLYAREHEIAEVLTRLRDDGLVRLDESGYRYDQSIEQHTAVDRLAEIYTRHLIPVTNMIHSKPRRIREFADAFKLRKDR